VADGRERAFDDDPRGAGPVVLFDGVCVFCAGAVQFLLEHGVDARVRFASLQSAYGRARLREHGLDPDALDTLVLVDEGRAYTRSTAALRIARFLRAPWPLLAALLVVPRALRDALYAVVARNRYRWFGKREACFVPTPEVRARFLEEA